MNAQKPPSQRWSGDNMTRICLFKNSRAACADAADRAVFPWLGIAAAVLCILLSIFISPYLNILALFICTVRIIRYGSAAFSTDYCILVTVSLLFQWNGTIFLPYLCLFAALWFISTEKIRIDVLALLLVLQFTYLLVRMNSGYTNLVLCFSQILLLWVILYGQNRQTAIISIKAFLAALLVTSFYAFVFRNTFQLVALRGREVPAYWMSSQSRFNGLFRDPNYYMSLLVVALALLLALRLKGELGRAAFLTMGVCFTVFGLLTYSKTFLILIVLVYIVYILLLLGKRRYLLAFAIVAATGLVIWIALQTEGSPLQIIVHRFATATTLDDLTTGRTELHLRYWNAITQNAVSFLFGYGLDAGYLRLSPHSLYLEILYHLGFFGLVIFLCEISGSVYLMNAKTSGMEKRSKLLTYAPLLLIGILFFSLAGVFSTSTYALIFLALVSMLV